MDRKHQQTFEIPIIPIVSLVEKPFKYLVDSERYLHFLAYCKQFGLFNRLALNVVIWIIELN